MIDAELCGVVIAYVNRRGDSPAGAIQSEAFLEGYIIDRVDLGPDHTQLTISIHIPVGMITADGVPPLEAITVLRSLANALETLDASGG